MEKVVVDEDVMDGQPRVRGTRVRVVDVVGFYEVRGLSPQEIEMPGVVKINGFPEPSELADSIMENLEPVSEEDMRNFLCETV
ncbi:MAG: DUF433 domain-containing protein [Candidatus Nanohalobium sp.]